MSRSDKVVFFESEWYTFDDGYLDKLRTMEKLTIDRYGYLIIIDYSGTASLYGFCGFVAYFWVTVCLIVVSFLIDNDVVEAVMNPLQSIWEKVDILSKKPMIASSVGFEDRAGIVQELQAMEGVKKKKGQKNEIAFVDQSIIKIASLLAIGYGSAGTTKIAEIIERSSEGYLDIDVKGERIMAVYCFCDIRNFTDSTVVLQTKVMYFVNQIAMIVHSNCVKYGGSPNKNIGDAFLFAWKLSRGVDDDIYCLENDEGGINQLPKIRKQSLKVIGDLILFCNLKIIAKINSLEEILEYRKNELLNERLPGYTVKMGFGIHLGWGIEGMIGSQYKLEASYLSPHVNMAARLEGGTKLFGVSILLSGQFYKILSKKFKQATRKIDVCTMKGSVKPLKLYTVDYDTTNLTTVKDKFRNMKAKQKKEIIEKEKTLLFNKLES